MDRSIQKRLEMAKSLLSNIKKNTVIPAKLMQSKVISIDLMKVPLIVAHRHSTHDLNEFTYFKCDINTYKVKGRLNIIKAFAKEIHSQKKGIKSDGTIENYIYEFKRYIVHCDKAGLDPFSKDGYLSYCGNWGELWKKVGEGNNRKRFLFDYNNGDVLGIKEITAMNKRVIINLCLDYCGFDVFHWKRLLKEFSIGVPSSALPYSKNELKLIVDRLQDFFYSVSSQILEYVSLNDEGLPPNSLVAEVKYHGSIRHITVEPYSKRKISSHDKGVFLSSPFNQCMTAGYLLIAYYSGFNDSTILDVSKPLRINKEKYNGRTIKYITIEGYKGRSGRYVESLLSDYNPEQEPLLFSVNKKDGFNFIKRLLLLSNAFSKNDKGKLIYHLDNSGRVVDFRLDAGSQLESSLELLSDSRELVLDHLISEFYSLVDEGFYTLVKTIKNSLGDHIVYKEAKKISSVKSRALSYAYAAFKCFSDIDFKGALFPVSISQRDIDGYVVVRFKIDTGNYNEFTVDYKYVKFIRRLELFSSQFINKKDIGTNKSYLFPVYQKDIVQQWEGIQFVSSHLLKDIGISNGDFLLDVSTSRFRTTTSDLEYNKEDNGAAARVILDHSQATQMTRYVNGHPVENNEIISQSLQVIEELGSTNDIELAKKNVLIKNKLEVLSYNSFLTKKKDTNINGVYCDGKSHIKQHLSTIKKIEKSHIFNKDDSRQLACYEFDKCFSCQNAKLVEDVQSIYKLLSFIDYLEEKNDANPTLENDMSFKISHFKEVLYENISINVIESAMERLIHEGRHFTLNDDIEA